MLEQLGCFVYRSGDEIDTNNLPDVAAFSISAHGTGLNLQQYDKAVIIEPPGSGLRWEQLLGRLHRPGQLADEVNFYVLSHTPQLRRSFVNALEDSRYIQDSTQQPQKLTFAVKTKG
jgi:superfamily II DNA or RNA helicase